jgi:hypothetical protein
MTRNRTKVRDLNYVTVIMSETTKSPALLLWSCRCLDSGHRNSVSQVIGIRERPRVGLRPSGTVAVGAANSVHRWVVSTVNTALT